MKNKLILYSENDNLYQKLMEYVEVFKHEIAKDDDVVVLFEERNELAEKVSDEFEEAFEEDRNVQVLFSVNQVTTNDLLNIINSWYSTILGGKQYSSKKYAAHIFLLFDIDNVQAEYLINLQKRSNVVYHIFFKKEKYDSKNLAVNLQDYIPFLNIDIIS